MGEVAIGNTTGSARVNLAQIVSRVDGNMHKSCDAGLTNVARSYAALIGTETSMAGSCLRQRCTT